MGHDFRRTSVHAPGETVEAQTRLVVSDPDDPLEREADRIADGVVGAGPPASASTGAGAEGVVQRQMAPEEDAEGALALDEPSDMEDDAGEDDLEVGGEDLADESGRPKLTAGASRSRSRHELSLPPGSGAPLPAPVRTTMESRFQRDFSAVRIHADEGAAAAARGLEARAFTVGQDIYFGPGADPGDTTEGRRLLAHELVHVVQQTRGESAPLIQRQKGTPKKSKGQTKTKAKSKGQGKKAAAKKTKVSCAKGGCGEDCIGAKPGVVHHPWCGNEKCPTSGPKDPKNFIRHLDVNLKTQMVVAELGTDKVASSSVGPFLTSPHPSHTPKGTHRIGVKCTNCHTNMKGEGMAYFTGFKGYAIGFHNSQKVAKGTFSHGCVRTPCSRAKWIRDNTWSGVTTVCVHTGDHCDRKVFGIKDPPAKGKGPDKAKDGKRGRKAGKKTSALPGDMEPVAAAVAGDDEEGAEA